MQYSTVTVVNADTPTLKKPVDTTICLRYTHVFDYEAYRSHTGSKLDLTRKNPDIFDYFTVQEIFNYTPPVSQLFSECWIRFPGDHELVLLSATQCPRKLSIVRFLTQGFMCYKVTIIYDWNSNKTYSYPEVARSLNFMGTLFKFELNVVSQVMKLTSNTWNTYPRTSLMFSPLVIFDKNAEQSGKQFEMTYTVQETHLLPPPYKTHCRTYRPEFIDQTSCRFECLRILTLKYFDKIPYEYLERNSSLTKKHISTGDIANATRAAMLARFRADCARRCPDPDCSDTNTVTRVTKTTSLLSKCGLYVTIPREPFLTIRFQEEMKLLDFAIYILSSAGIWLGISVTSLDPTNWVPHVWRVLSRKPETWATYSVTGTIYRRIL
ncbi:hypothetical protein HDE_14071 [Halotydeus destructor]|nr:hypothetical protein HDE_14071 [Halotydeus destructor]